MRLCVIVSFKVLLCYCVNILIFNHAYNMTNDMNVLVISQMINFASCIYIGYKLKSYNLKGFKLVLSVSFCTILLLLFNLIYCLTGNNKLLIVNLPNYIAMSFLSYFATNCFDCSNTDIAMVIIFLVSFVPMLFTLLGVKLSRTAE